MLSKTLLSLIMASCFIISLNAQTEKGTFSVGINVSPKILSHQSKDNNRLEFHGEIQAGYFLQRNFLVGGETSITRFRSKLSGEVNSSSNTYRLNAFARKYFDIKETKWKPFIGLSAGYGVKDNNSNISNSDNIVEYGPNVQAEVGIAYFIKENTSLHLSAYAQKDYFGGTKDHVSGGLKFGITHNFDLKKKKD